MQAYHRSYERYSVEAAPREDIMLKLMEGALIRLNRARECWAEGEETRARELRSQALAIITEFDTALDRENGPPDLVETLEGLYAYMEREIAASAPKDDFDRLQPVQDVLTRVYRAFEEATEEYKREQAGEARAEAAVTGPPVEGARAGATLNLQM